MMPRAFVVIGPNYELGEWYCRAIESQDRVEAVGFGDTAEIAKTLAVQNLSAKLDKLPNFVDKQPTM